MEYIYKNKEATRLHRGRTDPQRAPIFSLLHHVPNPIHDVKHAQAGLKIIDGLVEVSCSLLGLQERPLLLCKTAADLRDARIESGNLVPEIGRVRLESEHIRHRRDEILVVVSAYCFNFGVLPVDERLECPQVSVLLAVLMNLLDYWP